MKKRISWVAIDLDNADPQMVTTQNGTFVRATLTRDGENRTYVWYEHDTRDDYNHHDRKLLVVERNSEIRYEGYEYLDTVVSSRGIVYHIYQDVVRPDPVEPKKIEDKKTLWGTINYRVVVAQGNPSNIVFKVEANTPGVRSFLAMFTSYDEEVTNRIVRRVRDLGDKEELSCVGDHDMFYISVERVAEQ